MSNSDRTNKMMKDFGNFMRLIRASDPSERNAIKNLSVVNKIAKLALIDWYKATYTRERLGHLINLAVFWFCALVVTPLSYYFFVTPNITASASSTTGFTSIRLYIIYAITLLVIAATFRVANLFLFRTVSKPQNPLESGIFNEARMPVKDITLKVVPAKIIANLLRIHLIKTKNTNPVVYRASETDRYYVDGYVFDSSTKARYVIILLSLAVSDFVFAAHNSVASIGTTAVNIAIFIIVLIGAQALLATTYRAQSRKQLNASIANTNKINIQPLCSYEISVKRTTSNSLSSIKPSFMGKKTSPDDVSAVIGGINVNELSAQSAHRDSKAKGLTTNLVKLINDTYSTITLINSINPSSFHASNSERYQSDVNQLRLMTDSYIPDCLNSIQESLLAYSSSPLNSTAHNHSNESDVIIAYAELSDDILKQNDIILGIYNYYRSISATKVLNSVRGVIDRRTKGFQNDDESLYSLQTMVMNKSINQEVIPELEALMLDADDVTRDRLNEMVNKFKDFFQKQVDIDKQNAQILAIKYDKTVSIDMNINPSSSVSPADAYIEKAASYLDQLEQNW